MSRNKIGTNPDELRLRIKRQNAQIAAGERAAEVAAAVDAAAIAALDARVVVLEGAPPSTTTDTFGRWVRVTKQHTDFAGGAAIVTVSLGTYPAGTLVSHVRINPTVAWTTTLANTVEAQVPTPTNGAHYDGVIKTVSLSVPSPLQDQGASLFITGDPAAPTDFSLEVTVGGGETGNDLTAGTVVVEMFMSVPGATTDALPHS